MNTALMTQLVIDLLIVLAAGFVSGIICKRIGVSLLVGYLIVGALIGEGGLQFVSQEHRELEYLAKAGVLLLLFSVGIEFSLDELRKMSRFFAVGGATQMVLVAVPLCLVAKGMGMGWPSAFLAGSAGALSSTVLVFKALSEWGQSTTPHGRRAIGILLFQDVALVPLILMLPILTGAGPQPGWLDIALLLAKSALVIASVFVLRRGISRWLAPLLAGLRSVELVVLFTLGVVTGACLASYALGLPPAIGALAAGLMLSGNRLSRQVDTLILPFRESFAAIFFVTLGTLLMPLKFFQEPILLTAGLCGMLALKSTAAAVALRLTGLRWKAAFGMGIGLAQLGEFSFLLVADGVAHGLITPDDYNRMLFIALGTLVLTPQLLKHGLRWTRADGTDAWDAQQLVVGRDELVQHALVIGLGPIGRQIASRLELLGVDVCLVDLSPINLHPYEQQGFHTIAGDARDPDVLNRANAGQCRLAVVCVPADDAASQVVRSLREISRSMTILVRCRFMSNIDVLRRAGADSVISEEQEASGALLKRCEEIVHRPTGPSTP